MFYLTKRLNNILINCSSIIYIKLDPNDDTKIIFYLDTGEQITETYKSTEIAAEWLEIYRKALEGSGEYEELKRQIEVLRNTIDRANSIAEDILT